MFATQQLDRPTFQKYLTSLQSAILRIIKCVFLLNILCIGLAGHIIFHGPREEVMPFFNKLDFHLPERNDIGDFLQKVTSFKDQKVLALGIL